MFTRDPEGPPPKPDSLLAVEGKFRHDPTTEAVPNIEVTFLYTNGRQGGNFGTYVLGPQAFTLETVEAFRNFLQKAEQDAGRLVFEDGEITSMGAALATGTNAETGASLKGLGGK